MRNLLIVCVAIVIYGCAPERYEVFNEVNQAPVLEMNAGSKNNDSVWVMNEKLKLGLKTSGQKIRVVLKGKDAENPFAQLDAKFDAEKISVTDNQGETVSFPLVMPAENEVEIFVGTSRLGVHAVDFELMDELGKVTKGKLMVDAFENEPPVAVISSEAKYVGVNSINEYEISAAESFDNDEKYGGVILQYVWTLNGSEEFVTEDDHFKQSLSKGGYEVTLRVIDNDGVSSDIVEKLITIK